MDINALPQPYSIDEIRKNISQLLISHQNLTNAQAHNLSEFILLVHLVQQEINNKNVLEISQYIIDICFHLQSQNVIESPVLPKLHYILEDLQGNPKFIERVNKFFTRIITKLKRVDNTLKIMNLTSLILRRKEEGDLFKQHLAKYL